MSEKKKRSLSEETKQKLRDAAQRRKLEKEQGSTPSRSDNPVPHAASPSVQKEVDYDSLANRHPNKTIRQLYGMFKNAGMKPQAAWAEVLKRIR